MIPWAVVTIISFLQIRQLILREFKSIAQYNTASGVSLTSDRSVEEEREDKLIENRVAVWKNFFPEGGSLSISVP